ncbi:MAG TPA: NTF2 fold immunity protein [Fimbriimonadales bacterium]|nr:NTF2 fold immunity protein [Fimbriimonadales bacterium]
MIQKYFSILLSFALFVFTYDSMCPQGEVREKYINGTHYVIPKDGFVPNAETAIRIAEAVWIPIYGKDEIEKQKPFRTTMKDKVWTVTGTLSDKNNSGNVLIAKISKVNGKIILVSLGKNPYVPKSGFVPDAATAKRIAEAVWIPIYGKKQIEKEKPFRSRLENNVWMVLGTAPEYVLAGEAIAEISKNDGRILHVSHTE